MLSDITKTSARIEIGRRHPYAVLLGLKAFGTVVVLAALAVMVLGVRWLVGHLSVPNVSIPIPNASGASLGLVALAVVGCVAITLLVRRIVRHVRYGV